MTHNTHFSMEQPLKHLTHTAYYRLHNFSTTPKVTATYNRSPSLFFFRITLFIEMKLHAFKLFELKLFRYLYKNSVLQHCEHFLTRCWINNKIYFLFFYVIYVFIKKSDAVEWIGMLWAFRKNNIKRNRKTNCKDVIMWINFENVFLSILPDLWTPLQLKSKGSFHKRKNLSHTHTHTHTSLHTVCNMYTMQCKYIE